MCIYKILSVIFGSLTIQFSLSFCCKIVDHKYLFFLLLFSFAKKEDIKDFWLAQGLDEAIPLLQVQTTVSMVGI